MFSNRLYFTKMMFFTTIILVSLFYGAWRGPVIIPTIEAYLKNPQKYEGHAITLSKRLVAEVERDRFTVITDKKRVTVSGSVPGLEEGDYIDLKAVFHNEAPLILEKAYIRENRWVKYLISIVPVPFIIFLFFKEFKIVPKKFGLFSKRGE